MNYKQRNLIMLIHKKILFFFAEAARINKDYQRKKSLEGIVRSWLIDKNEANRSLATDQDKRNTRRLNAVMSELLADRNSLLFRRIAKTLDWEKPNCSLIIELALLDKIGNRLYLHSLPIALHLDTVLSNTGESKLLQRLKDDKRSSDLDSSIRLLNHRRQENKQK